MASGEVINKIVKYFLYKKGYLKKNYIKYKKWLEKKGTLYSLIYFEFNLVNISNSMGRLTLVHLYTLPTAYRLPLKKASN